MQPLKIMFLRIFMIWRNAHNIILSDFSVSEKAGYKIGCSSWFQLCHNHICIETMKTNATLLMVIISEQKKHMEFCSFTLFCLFFLQCVLFLYSGKFNVINYFKRK